MDRLRGWRSLACLLGLLGALLPGLAAGTTHSLQAICERLQGQRALGGPVGGDPRLALRDVAAQIETLPLINRTAADLNARLVPDGSGQIFEIRRDLDPQRYDFFYTGFLGRPTDTPKGDGTPIALPLLRLERITPSADERARASPADAAGAWTRLHLVVPALPAALPWRWSWVWPIEDVTVLVAACPRPAQPAPPPPGDQPGGTAPDRPSSNAGTERPAPQPLLAMDSMRVSIGWVAMAWTLAAGVAVFAIFAATSTGSRGARTWGRRLDPVVITQNEHGVGSLSRLQILFFSLIVFTTLTYIALRAGFLSEISAELLALLGIAGAGTVAARVAASAKEPTGAAPPAPPPVAPTPPGGAAGTPQAAAPPRPASADRAVPQRLGTDQRRWLRAHGLMRLDRQGEWRDLLNTQGEFDVYKAQMLIFSLMVGVAILFSGLNGLASFVVPANLMLLLGLSQLVYVGGKAVLTPDCRALNEAVNTAIEAESTLLAQAQAIRTQVAEVERQAGTAAPAETEALRDAARTLVEAMLSGLPAEEAAVAARHATLMTAAAQLRAALGAAPAAASLDPLQALTADSLVQETDAFTEEASAVLPSLQRAFEEAAPEVTIQPRRWR